MPTWRIASMAAAAALVLATSVSDSFALSCESGCNLARRACRIDAWIDCTHARGTCRDVRSQCSDSCDGNRVACTEACDDSFSDCRTGCVEGDDLQTCRAACAVDREACASACGGSREGCREQCDADGERCSSAAKSQRVQVNAECEKATDQCFRLCAASDQCVDACEHAAAICFGHARRGFNGCRAQCGEGAEAKDCRRDCRAVQVDANGACGQAAKTCLDGCEQPTATSTPTESTTTLPGSAEHPEPSSFLEYVEP